MIDLSVIDVEDLMIRLDISNARLTSSGDEVNFSCFGAEHSHGDESPSAYMNVESSAWMCFAGETKVITKDFGRCEIRDLVGTGTQFVLTRGGVWAETEFKEYGRDRLVHLTLSRNGIKKVIRTTAEHRWFAGWSVSETKYNERTTLELKPKQVLQPVFPKWSPARRDTGISPIGVMHGFVFGDGNHIKNGCVANFFGEKDNQLREWFLGTSEYVSGDRFTLNGMPRSWKKVPDLDEGSQYLYGWLAGYFAADGDVANDGCASLNSASKKHLEHVRAVCDRLGIGTSSISTYRRKGFGKEISDIYRLRFFTEDLSSGFFLLEEHQKNSRYTKKFERRRWQVVSVEQTDEIEVVYCCEVDKTHAFALDDNILTGNCHGCKKRGNAITFVMDVQHISRATAERQLREWYGIEFNEPMFGSMVAETEARLKPKEILPDPIRPTQTWLNMTVCDWDDEGEAQAYMRDRKFTKDVLDEWKIGYDYVSNRITIPVHNLDGDLHGIKGRAHLPEHQPKYLILGDRDKLKYGFSPYEASQVVYGLHRNRSCRTVALCEGELNAVALSAMGVERPIATGMSYLSARHAQLIIREADEVIVFYDQGDAGFIGTWGSRDAKGKFKPGIVQQLEQHVVVRIVSPPEQDPADLMKINAADYVRELIEGAPTSTAVRIAMGFAHRAVAV